jgi:ribonuclease J
MLFIRLRSDISSRLNPELSRYLLVRLAKQFHASGHASREDIAWAIEQIDPDYIIPIHAEARDWFAESFENVFLVDEGRPYEF